MERNADRAIWVAIGLLLVIMAVFIGLRLATDVPNVLSGAMPDQSEFEYRYAAYPWLAYAHIRPGRSTVAGAVPAVARLRNRNLKRHRRIGLAAPLAARDLRGLACAVAQSSGLPTARPDGVRLRTVGAVLG